MITAKEWSIWIGRYCLGIARGNNGQYFLVYRYPVKTDLTPRRENIGGKEFIMIPSGSSEVNCFIPLWGKQG